MFGEDLLLTSLKNIDDLYHFCLNIWIDLLSWEFSNRAFNSTSISEKTWVWGFGLNGTQCVGILKIHILLEVHMSLVYNSLLIYLYGLRVCSRPEVTLTWPRYKFPTFVILSHDKRNSSQLAFRAAIKCLKRGIFSPISLTLLRSFIIKPFYQFWV